VEGHGPPTSPIHQNACKMLAQEGNACVTVQKPIFGIGPRDHGSLFGDGWQIGGLGPETAFLPVITPIFCPLTGNPRRQRTTLRRELG